MVVSFQYSKGLLFRSPFKYWTLFRSPFEYQTEFSQKIQMLVKILDTHSNTGDLNSRHLTVRYMNGFPYCNLDPYFTNDQLVKQIKIKWLTKCTAKMSISSKRRPILTPPRWVRYLSRRILSDPRGMIACSKLSNMRRGGSSSKKCERGQKNKR